MRMRSFLFGALCFLLSIIVLCAAGCSKTAHGKKTSPAFTALSLDDTLSLQEACSRVSAHLCLTLGSADTSSLGLFNMVLDRSALAVTQTTGDTMSGYHAVDAIIHTVYRSWNIGFDPRDSLVETLLPHLVFKNRKGACVGVALLILMLAEKLDLPVYGVMLPGHFLCRYDDGRVRRNIEPNRGGCEHPDEYYLKRYSLEHRPGYGFANIDKKAVVGVLCYNAGALCLKQKNFDAAIAFYREAVRRVPSFAEAQGNLAVAYARKGNLDTSLTILEELFAAHPDMANLALNYGYVATAAKQYPKALEIYREGLKYFPRDTAIIKRLDKISSGFVKFGHK